VSDEKKIIFIVGNSRSGTTMLGRVFNNHSQVYTFGELHFFEQIVSRAEINKNQVRPDSKLLLMLERLLTSSRDSLFSKVVKNKYREEAKNILTLTKQRDALSIYKLFLQYETRLNRKLIPCEQTPRYLFSTSEILGNIKEAKVINLIRDPRAVLLSQKNKWRRRFLGASNIPLLEAFRSWVNYHPYTIAKLWVSSVNESDRLQNNRNFISIHFEDLLTDPEKNVETLCRFVDLEFEQEMLNVPQVGSSFGIDNPEKKGINPNRMLSWDNGKLSALEIAICQKVAAKQMKRLGYTLKQVNVPKWRIVFSIMNFGFKISLSLILNLKRSKNILQSIMRRLISSREVSNGCSSRS